MHTHTHTHAYSLTCAEGIYSQHTWFTASKLALVHTLTAIIRSRYLKIRGNSENKASSKAEREGETVGEELGGCDGREGAHHQRKRKGVRERERGKGNLRCVEMPQLLIWLFRHLFILIGRSVLSSVDAVVPSLLPNNGPVSG